MRIVMKFGGTSVGDIDRIKNIAKKVKKSFDSGNEICVVVSAMSGVTNQLIDYVEQASPNYDPREYDAIVSSGEKVTSGLLALCLQEIGVKSRSFAGWQAGIETDGAHSKARITNVNAKQITDYMENGGVAVVAGFQGINIETNRITTLGRGGSDTSAVALAVGVNASRCDIYTDVDGVFTTDPRIVSDAKKIDVISFEEMLELASLGSKVLQPRSVEIAMSHNMELQVLNSFEDKKGTIIKNEDENMEKQNVRGITAQKDEAQITISGIKDKPGVVANVFEPISNANINVDMIIQTTSVDGETTDITFTVSEKDADLAIRELKKAKDKINYNSLKSDKNIAKLSVVGIGMRSHSGISQTMFKTLAEKGINIKDIATSEIKISVLIESDYVELAIRALHSSYNLEK